MRRNGFLRFCDYPGIACCEAEAELGQLRAENARLRAELIEARHRATAAIEDMALIAGQSNSALTCNCCKYNPNDMGCELDGSQFDDAGECHFTWCEPEGGKD